jgi:hypothetical protein
MALLQKFVQIQVLLRGWNQYNGFFVRCATQDLSTNRGIWPESGEHVTSQSDSVGPSSDSLSSGNVMKPSLVTT